MTLVSEKSDGMIEYRCQLRVRYADTDAMGVVYYSKYFEYFEVARTELLRACGLPYAKIEQIGFFLPVTKAAAQFIKGATYDELLTILVRMPSYPSPRLEITYEIFAANSDLLATGETTLAFVSRATGKPARPPQEYRDAVEQFKQSNKS